MLMGNVSKVHAKYVANGDPSLCHSRPPATLPSPQSLRASVAGGCVALRAGERGNPDFLFLDSRFRLLADRE